MNVMPDIQARIEAADTRYGPFASTHEALGVACEEWDEFRQSIQENDLRKVAHEGLDLAACLIRLAQQLRDCNYIHERSGK